ncbi:lectin [[Haemophilus] ducreyi]|uniref:Lectin A n=1 Tax=Haemophilus ducreyi TaxID=730 RepID=Q67BF6_HAEDC|nr:lectin [[Haemophilus] ducreyi]AAR23979.1 lectin A [[Haemophilus] ducreyi HMC112]AAR23975.1 lectin A [[Haemophilus] ducreyi]AAR23976.1 lectin A [[Haemophilus] ducreyi]AAR23977.1 lectin A [[Haemophilus] ducreyi]AAR23978.1 lectin A [[Haemophilus] ducreyi]
MKTLGLFSIIGLLSGCVYAPPAVDNPIEDTVVIQSEHHHMIYHESDKYDRDKYDRNDRYPHYHYTGEIRTYWGKCLDQSRSNYKGIISYRCHGGDNQRFTFYRDSIRVNGQCLDVGSENKFDGARIIAYRCHGGKNQRWFRQGHQIRSEMNGKCLEVGRDRNKLTLQQCDGSRSQQFFY